LTDKFTGKTIEIRGVKFAVFYSPDSGSEYHQTIKDLLEIHEAYRRASTQSPGRSKLAPEIEKAVMVEIEAGLTALDPDFRTGPTLSMRMASKVVADFLQTPSGNRVAEVHVK
jgi:hypothetical protein